MHLEQVTYLCWIGSHARQRPCREQRSTLNHTGVANLIRWLKTLSSSARVQLKWFSHPQQTLSGASPHRWPGLLYIIICNFLLVGSEPFSQRVSYWLVFVGTRAAHLLVLHVTRLLFFLELERGLKLGSLGRASFWVSYLGIFSLSWSDRDVLSIN